MLTKLKLFEGKRICRVCGLNIDIKDLNILFHLHSECWRTYRKKGWFYPLPANV